VINNMHPHSGEFFQELDRLKDVALDASYKDGWQYKLGGLVVSSVRAEWGTEDGGLARLSHEGIEMGAVSIPFMPTKLVVTEDAGNALARTEYHMALPRQFTEIHHGAITWNQTLMDMHRQTRARAKDRKLGLTYPDEDDMQRLHSELERGASGVYHRRPGA
jgi:hypothetical protein